MKKFYFLLLVLLQTVFVQAQTTIFSENLGVPTGTTAITAYTGWQNAGTLTYTNGAATNSADVRATNASSTYTGASGGGNVFFTATSGEYGFAIEGINASTFTSLNLQFGYRKESGTALPNLALDYWNGTAWQNVPFTFTEAANAATGWYLSPVINLPAAAQISGLKLRWVKTGTASVRIDDIVLKGTSGGGSTPTITTTGTVNDFGSVTVGTASASQQFSVSGTNLTGAPAVITITSISPHFEVSNNNSSWGNSATINYTSATLAATSVYVRFAPQATGVQSGLLAISGGGVNPAVTVAVSGIGQSVPAPVATAATAITGSSFTANWNAVAGATGYRLDVYTLTSGTATGDVAGWNFATNTAAALTADLGNANNAGVQTVTSVGTVTPLSFPAGPSGSSGTPNPYSVSASGWDNGADAKYWQVDLNTTGATNLTLSSLQGSSNTGPSAFKVQYRVGTGGTWQDVPGATVTLTVAVAAGNLATWGALNNVALPAAAENQPLVSLRWISTSNTAVNGSAVAAGGTSRISAIYVRGTVTASVPSYVTGYQNFSVGNVTSQSVTGLNQNTTYYYVVRAENGVGTSANSNEISLTTTAVVSPALSATAPAAFGAVCLNTASASGSFTINGSNLSTASVTVGPLAGYSFATAAAGPYSTTLTLPQGGGSFSQTVFVQLTPTAVQSYNGNIPVSGGGATAINVAVSGSGIDSAPGVATGGSSAVTSSGATLAGTISSNGCTAITAYGIEYSTVSGFANGSGTAVAGSNLASGSFSVALTGLLPATTYYYKAYATNSGGTTYGVQQSFTTASTAPSLSAGALPSFGNACINVVAGPNSFSLSGTNLTTADVVVGPLAGYTFATSATGTYSNTLTISQPGGNLSQTVFVRFLPTALQSYSGGIPVSGGGTATPIAVSVIGNGINTAPSVTTGTASAPSSTGATLGGTITATGCSAITAYGIEYSTVSGFTTGIQVSSTNLAGGSFSATLTGLAPSTTYYYKAFATNGGGTSYGTQQSFTTAAPPPALLSATSLTAFGNVCVGTASAPNSFVLSGTNLSNANITVGPLAGFAFSTTAGGTYTPSLTLTQGGGSLNQTVFVQFTPTAAQAFGGNIAITGGGTATTINVLASGTGVSTPPAVTTGTATAITASGATLSGSITANGCSAVTGFGIEYSPVTNFTPGTGTRINAAGQTGGSFSVPVSGLVPGATYYFRALATNSGGAGYGELKSFTIPSIPAGFVLYPVPAMAGGTVRFSRTGLQPGFHAIHLYNSSGQRVYTKTFAIQVDFIMDAFTLPANLQKGVYRIQLVTNTTVIENHSILVL
jgi:hypothetical protein